MHCRFLQPRFWEHKKSRDRTLESGGKELVDFGGTLVSAGGMRRYAGIRCIFVGGILKCRFIWVTGYFAW